MVKDMTKGSPMKLILGFAIPMLMGMLFQQFYNLVDTMIVGKTLGVDALAGVGATACINFMIIGFCMGVCNGFAIPVAQQFGAGKYSELRKYVYNGYICSIIFSVVLTVASVVGCRGILTLLRTIRIGNLYARELQSYDEINAAREFSDSTVLYRRSLSIALFFLVNLCPQSDEPAGDGGDRRLHGPQPV